jgi:hypothetical protein
MAEYLPSKHEALSSNTSTAKKKKTRLVKETDEKRTIKKLPNSALPEDTTAMPSKILNMYIVSSNVNSISKNLY